MRYEALAREVASSLIADSGELTDLDGAGLFAEAAVVMQKWPKD